MFRLQFDQESTRQACLMFPPKVTLQFWGGCFSQLRSVSNFIYIYIFFFLRDFRAYSAQKIETLTWNVSMLQAFLKPGSHQQAFLNRRRRRASVHRIHHCLLSGLLQWGQFVHSARISKLSFQTGTHVCWLCRRIEQDQRVFTGWLVGVKTHGMGRRLLQVRSQFVNVRPQKIVVVYIYVVCSICCALLRKIRDPPFCCASLGQLKQTERSFAFIIEYLRSRSDKQTTIFPCELIKSAPSTCRCLSQSKSEDLLIVCFADNAVYFPKLWEKLKVTFVSIFLRKVQNETKSLLFVFAAAFLRVILFETCTNNMFHFLAAKSKSLQMRDFLNLFKRQKMHMTAG